MRSRAIALSTSLMLIALFAVLIGALPNASATLQADGTPVSGTPVDDATPVAADEDETPTPDESGIITIVLWYQQSSDGEVLQLMPITSDGILATRGEAADESQEGRVVFDESRNEGYPRIRVGEENYFDAYPVYPDDPNTVQRWIFFDDDPALRPATMVMQIVGIRGDYEDWTGTASFISRGLDQGGIMVIAISPPADE